MSEPVKSPARAKAAELLPCPFCGSAAQHEPWHGGAPTKTMIQCSHFDDTCDVGPMVSGETFAEAAARWNHRSSAPTNDAARRAEKAEARVAELEALINSPETDDWLKGARIEAAHQIERWGAQHDAGKSAWDWFWLIGYLAQKAAAAQVAGDAFKAKHHTISTAAALLNWHRHVAGTDQRMRPGIDPVERGVA